MNVMYCIMNGFSFNNFGNKVVFIVIVVVIVIVIVIVKLSSSFDSDTAK